MSEVVDPKTEQGIGVWCFDDGEDAWVAATSEEEAVQWYEDATGLKVADPDSDDDPSDDIFVEVSQVSDLDKHRFYDVDDEGEIADDTPQVTFREGIRRAIAQGDKSPFMLCAVDR